MLHILPNFSKMMTLDHKKKSEISGEKRTVCRLVSLSATTISRLARVSDKAHVAVADVLHLAVLSQLSNAEKEFLF